MSESDFQKIFEELTMPWFYSNPLFFRLFCMQKLNANPLLQIPFRVGKNLIEYNPKIIAQKNRDNIRKDLILELTRIILHHPFRHPENDKDFDIELWYEASTMTITQQGVAAHGFQKDMDIEYYYKQLRKEKNGNMDEDENTESLPFSDITESDTEIYSESGTSTSDMFNTNASSFFSEEDSKTGRGQDARSDEVSNKLTVASDTKDAENGTEATDSNPSDAESNNAKEGSELWSCDDKEASKAIDNFMKENKTLWGSLPDNVESLLSLLNAKRARIPSCIKLLEYFKAINNSCYSLTRMRPSRRFGYSQMGKKRRPEPGKILAGIDVSGSIDDEQILKFYHAVSNVFDRGIKNVEIFQFDTELKTPKPLPFKKCLQIKVLGRGGTSFQALFDYSIKHQRDYDGLIIFTDGCAAGPEIHHRLTTKVLWVLNDKQSFYLHKESLNKTGFVTVLA